MIDIGGVIMAILVCITVFFVCRELVCWYFKFNKIVGILEDIKNLLESSSTVDSSLITRKQRSFQLAKPIPPKKTTLRYCSHCNAGIPIGATFCENCGEKLSNKQIGERQQNGQ